MPSQTSPFDWSTFQAKQRATLVFIRRDDEVLLIHKKRGLGAGKINGPGGRIDPGETPTQCAIREVQEELHVTPIAPKLAGELLFQFVDGLSIHGYVFVTGRFEGMPIETDEAIPLWTNVNAIPYDRMWVDDQLWMPHLLARRMFVGKFYFDGDRMLWDHVETL